jgi:uncharacterized protein YbjT (DUF2867 family)
LDVVVAGGHGKVALALERMLAERGHGVRGLIRNPDHAADLERVGAEPVIFDLESGVDLPARVRGADAVVFAAGAGPGSGPERKRSVDLGGAIKLIEAARAADVRRYAMVSAIGARDPADGPEKLRPYLEAKAEADAALARSGLDFTIVRPGGLTDDPGTGRVTAGPDIDRGDIPREDVAAVLLAVLEADGGTVGKTFNVVAGETPVEDAVRAL